MKLNIQLISVAVCLVIAHHPAFAQSNPPGQDTSLEGSGNFFQLQAKMNAYFKNNPDAKGEKIWRRKEWFLEPRLYPSGEFRNITRLTLKAYHNYTKSTAATRLSHANWSFLGPLENATHSGLGRVNCVIVHPSNANIMYVGASNGGIWKTTNGGTSWTNISPDIPLLAIADLGFDPNDANVIYALTGDGDPLDLESGFHSSTEVSSAGIIRSTNGGSTWYFTNFSFSHPSNLVPHKLLINPNSADTQFVAAKNGLWRTTNHWVTWDEVVLTTTYDVEYHPTNTDKMYCSGPNWIRRSTNGGSLWTSCSDPDFVVMGPSTRVELAVTPDFETVVYALAGNFDDGTHVLYRSILEGLNNTWVIQDSSTNITSAQTPYNIALIAKYNDDTDLFAGGVLSLRSLNASGTPCCWDTMNINSVPHADVHDMVYQNGVLYVASDGGLYRSSNDGDTWDDLSNGLAITEIYRIAGTPQNIDLVYCGTQDNGTMKYTGTPSFSRVLGGDGMTCQIDYSNSDKVYASQQYGVMLRSTNGGNNWSDMAVPGDKSAWITPMEIDHVLPSVVFVGRDSLYRSDNSGNAGSWVYLGAPAALDLNCVEQGISNRNIMYVSALSSIWRTANALTNSGPATWTNVTSGLPGQFITGIAIDPNDANNIFVSLSGFSDGDKVFHSILGGQGGTWTNISGSLPNVAANCIVFHDNGNNNNALYVGTDIGVFYRDDDLGDWIYYSNYLPAVNISDLYINTTSSKLVVGTFGRGLWETDLYEACQTTLLLQGSAPGGTLFYSTTYSITSSQTHKPDIGTVVHYAAGNFIDLKLGFHVFNQAFFEGKIASCPAIFSEPMMTPWVSESKYVMTEEQFHAID